MSKSSTASTPKIPATQLSSKSAWAKGPPQNTSSSPRSQSPAPSNTAPAHASHSRRPSTLGQSIPIKDGVSIPRNNVGATKTGSAVSFGSIDDASATISSSPATTPAMKPPPEGVKSFGSVPAAGGQINGKSSVSSSAKPSLSQTSSTTSVSGASTSSTSSVAKPDKMDIRKLFQNPSSAPSSHPPSDTSSPATRTSNLPPQGQPPSIPPAGSSSQMGGHQYTPFVPNNMRPGQNTAAGGGPGSAPRSPVYPRQQMPNGNGPRPPNGANGPAGPSQMSGGMGSPRLAPHPHPGQQPNMATPPQMQPPVPMPPWGNYYYGIPAGMPPEQAAAYMYPGWYGMPQQHSMPPQHQLPHHPSAPGAPHTGMPMSPRNPPPPLQGPPGTPTPAHAAAAPHSPHPPPPLSHSSSGSVSGLSSPPPTPSTASMPGSARLNQNASTFVPGARASKITIKSSDGSEVNLETYRKTQSQHGSSPSVTSPPLISTGSASPSRRPAIRIEAPEDKKKREEKEKEEARAKAEKERKEKEAAEAKAREERLKKEKEEEERRKKEEEEERKKKEEKKRKEEEEKEKERLKKEEEKEQQRLAEERQRKEEERKRREEEEERLRKEEEERVKKEEEEKEKERVRKEVEEATAAAKAKAEEEATAKVEEQEEGEIIEFKDAEPTSASKEDGRGLKEKKVARTDPSAPESHSRRRPGPLDLSINTKPNIPAPPPSALATARIIDDLGRVPYPEGVKSPKVELNINAKDGKFRYDREFLLQFMSICKEKPDMLPPLDAIGLEPSDQTYAMHRTNSGRGKTAARQSSIGLGFSGSSFGGKPGAGATFTGMGNFGNPNTSKLTSEERFQLANAGRAVSVSGVPGMQFTRPGQMQRTASQGGAGTPMENRRSRSKRGGDRDPNKAASGQSHGSGFGHAVASMGPGGVPLEPVAPLQVSANRWDRKALGGVDPDSPEVVDRKVKALLNKLTMEKFDSISDQIIAWANKSEKETDGRTLIQVIRLVFEKATDEATWSEMYARLCRKMMEQISPKVQDEGIKNSEGKPIAGGQLFRKYLLNRCQEDFERGWVNKEATAAAAATKALEDQAVKAANEKKAEGEEEVALYSDEYYAAQKAKRQGLGLIKFIGELFKLQMLTERIMHECVKKLLGNVENPEEEEIESLCKLLTTVGQILDTTKARAHMDVYFSRMKELTKSQNVSARMQFMLQDVIELRDRKWVARNAVAAPTTIAKIHEAAAKEKEKEGYQRTISMSRGGSRRGGDRNDYQQVGADGWAVAGGNAPRPQPKAGDLSNFGKISKGAGAPMTFGPSSVFAGKKDNKRESLSRTNSSANMFSMLQNVDPATEAAARNSSRPPSRKPSVDLGPGGAPEPVPQRKRLILQPRSKPLDQDIARPQESDGSSDEEVTEEPEVEMSEAEAKKKIDEDTKEFFGVRSLDEAEIYFSKLPSNHHHRLVDKLVSMALESKEADAKLVGEFFERASSKKLCSPSAFEEAFLSVTEFLDDIAIDAPKAPNLLATMMKGVGFSEEQRTRIASKSEENGDKLIELLS